jgi:hypothetical protein
MIKMRGRIKVGTSIFQDFGWGKWPDAAIPPLSMGDKPIDADMLFEVEWHAARAHADRIREMAR